MFLISLPVSHQSATGQQDKQVKYLEALQDRPLIHIAVHHVLFAAGDLVLTFEHQDAARAQHPIGFPDGSLIQRGQFAFASRHRETSVDDVSLVVL